jgi:hypothetical protein
LIVFGVTKDGRDGSTINPPDYFLVVTRFNRFQTMPNAMGSLGITGSFKAIPKKLAFLIG